MLMQYDKNILSGVPMFQRLAIIGLAVAAVVGLSPAQENRKSPHDTASVSLGGKNVTITYGRPYLHGRKAIGGSLVPFGQVWRTGADEATKLTSDADLLIGDLKVPEGSYSLFTIPEKEHWTLIVNKVADQWGAFKYDSSKDLGRTPLKVEHLSSPVEEFTISLGKSSGSATELGLAWENTKAATTIKLAQ
jgi:Protein of unknown function (DUF2911)